MNRNKIIICIIVFSLWSIIIGVFDSSNVSHISRLETHIATNTIIKEFRNLEKHNISPIQKVLTKERVQLNQAWVFGQVIDYAQITVTFTLVVLAVMLLSDLMPLIQGILFGMFVMSALTSFVISIFLFGIYHHIKLPL